MEVHAMGGAVVWVARLEQVLRERNEAEAGAILRPIVRQF